MKWSEEKTLTTHVGSLPRTDELLELHEKRDKGEEINKTRFHRAAKESTEIAVDKQIEAGIDIINNGEQPRVGFDTYVYNRINGFGGKAKRKPIQDVKEFPSYAEEAFPEVAVDVVETPMAQEEINYTDLSMAREEINDFKEMLEKKKGYEEAFLTAASPGAISGILLNDYYSSHKEYVYALAREMKKEYEAINDNDLILQLDAPDLAMERHWMFQELSNQEFQEVVETHIDAINKATKSIPRENIRLHVCWGNYEGPHHKDIKLIELLPKLYEANVGAISIELANPRHQHEYKAFKEHTLPKDKAVLPGVIDVKTNIIEHPKTVKERITNVAEAIGDPTRVIASTDCGFGTFAGWRLVNREIAWKKLSALKKGAELATKQLY